MAMHEVNVECRVDVCGTGEVPLAELQIIGQITRIMQAGSSPLYTRIRALRNVATRARALAKELEERATHLTARRQANGSIKLFNQAGAEIWQMGEAAAAALRDQLDVALHVPPHIQASNLPIDPPSRL